VTASADTATVAPGTYRARVLAHLERHPGLASTQIRRALGLRSDISDLLQDMLYRGEVVAGSTWRADQGRHVSLWHIAPAGTIPPPRPAPDPQVLQRRRERDARTQRARLRTATHSREMAAPALTAGRPPCAADPALFFPDTEAEAARAAAICRGCPVRRQCLEQAIANGEVWGIWGGANFAERHEAARTGALAS
jgi:transcription factor WhiB